MYPLEEYFNSLSQNHWGDMTEQRVISNKRPSCTIIEMIFRNLLIFASFHVVLFFCTRLQGIHSLTYWAPSLLVEPFSSLARLNSRHQRVAVLIWCHFSRWNERKPMHRLNSSGQCQPSIKKINQTTALKTYQRLKFFSFSYVSPFI